MKLVTFSKLYKEKGIDELVAWALENKLDGYDLCVREGFPVNPENAEKALPEAVATMRAAGLEIPMVTGEGGLLEPDDPTAEPLVAAMAEAGVPRLKLGYFRFDPAEMDYWEEVGKARAALEGWQQLAAKYDVTILYHTHSNRCLGLNCASMMHLLQGFDPQYIGAYIDPGHMVIEGEEFAVGLAMVREYLSAVAFKDAMNWRKGENGHGMPERYFGPAGSGVVNWTQVLSELARIGFDGPISVHCEFKAAEGKFEEVARQEYSFFRSRLDAVV